MMNKQYKNEIIELIDLVYNKEEENIKKAAKIIFDAMQKDLVLHVFATGHSHMMAEELFYRAGGLVQVDPVLVPVLMQHEGAVRSTEMERLPGMAKVIYNHLNLKENEPFLIISNSGINSVPVEMAEICKANNHPVIVLTSKESSEKLKSRTISNKHLYEVCDVCIDNHTPYGDGVIDTKYGKVGASSTVICSFIMQSLVLEVIDLYEQKGLVPPIYISANTDGGDEHNKKLYEKYEGRIKSLY